MIEWVADHFRARELVHFGVRPLRDDEPLSLVADMAKVERVLGWRASTSIESGLERLLPKLGTSSPASSRWRGDVGYMRIVIDTAESPLSPRTADASTSTARRRSS